MSGPGSSESESESAFSVADGVGSCYAGSTGGPGGPGKTVIES